MTAVMEGGHGGLVGAAVSGIEKGEELCTGTDAGQGGERWWRLESGMGTRQPGWRESRDRETGLGSPALSGQRLCSWRAWGRAGVQPGWVIHFLKRQPMAEETCE